MENNNIHSNNIQLSDAKSELLNRLLKKDEVKFAFVPDEIWEGELSSAQQRLYFVQNLDPKSGFYNVPTAIEINTNINLVRFEKAIHMLTQKHKILLTSYHERETSGLIQRINQNHKVVVEYIDFENCYDQNTDQKVIQFILEETKKPLPLEEPPIRYYLIKKESSKFIFLFIAHHIMIDGWSTEILVKDLKEFYEKGEKTSTLEEENNTYLKYSLWEKDFFKTKEYKNSLEYWKQKLEGSIEPVELPKDYIRKSESSHKGDSIIQYILPEQLTRINQFISENKVSKSIYFYTCLVVLLHKLSSKEDITVGTQIANRKYDAFNKIAGLFANTVVLRTAVQDFWLFSDLLRECNKTLLEAFTHQYVPFNKIVEMKDLKRDISVNPIFQIMFVYQVSNFQELKIDNGLVSSIQFHNGTSKFDLDISITEFVDKVAISFEYNTELFKRDTIKMFLEYYLNILNQNFLMDKRICDIDILSSNEKRKITLDWNATGTKVEYSDAPIQNFIEAWEKKDPDKNAILTSNQKISRGELANKANQIAWKLIQMKLEKRPIGICIDRSVNMVSALLGIIKSGSPYLPIDPILPDKRIEYMINDCQVPIVITSSEYTEKFRNTNAKVFNIDEFEWNLITENPAVNVRAEDLLYVIYTSGTSGKPKGVMLNHKGRVNNFFDFINRFHIAENDRLLSVSALSFDMTAFDILGVLASGAAIVLPDKTEEREPEKWYELIDKYKVSIWHSAPALLKLLIEKMETDLLRPMQLRLVLLGGDWIPLDLQRRLSRFNGKMQYISLGGATEVSMDSTIYEVEKTEEHWKSIPYGYPMANQRAYVVDSTGIPVPVGVAGELCLGGIGVGYGYINQPRLTAEKFIPDSYWVPGARMYRTGDLAKYHSNGALELLGRIDFQIKIDGYRIETGEIETHIKQFPNIDSSVVTVCKDKNRKDKLVAFYTVKDREAIDTVKLRYNLADKVPYYMVPVIFTKLDKIPLSPNGKVNRLALPNPLVAQSRRVIVSPETYKEQILCRIWSNILNTEIESINDDFFELGGDSIKAIQIVAEIRKLGFTLELKDIIKYPTVKELAVIIEQQKDYDQIPLTGEQLYLLVTNQYDKVSTIRINIPAATERSEVARWLKEVVDNIDVFRLAIVREEMVFRQYYAKNPSEVIFSEQNFWPEETQYSTIKKDFKFGSPFPIQAIYVTSSGKEEDTLFVTISQLYLNKMAVRALEKILLGYRNKSLYLERAENSFSILAEGSRDIDTNELYSFFRTAKKFTKEIELDGNQIIFLLEQETFPQRIGFLNRASNNQNTVLKFGCYENFYWNKKKDKIEAIFVLENRGESRYLNIYVSADIPEAELTVIRYIDELIKVDVEHVRSYTPLPMQRHMVKQMQERSIQGLYMIQSGFFIPGYYNNELFINAFKSIIDKFEILRAYFFTENQDKVKIAFKPQIELPLTELDWTGYSEQKVRANIQKLSNEFRNREFDLKSAPLWHLFIITINEGLTLVLLINCYALLDGWSMFLLRKELFAVYQKLVIGEPICVKEEPLLFSDCCERYSNLDISSHKDYWMDKIGIVNMEPSFKKKLEFSGKTDMFFQMEFPIKPSVIEKLINVSQKTHLTKTVLITYAWGKMMEQRNECQKVLIGLTLSGRTVEVMGINNVPGIFINTIPVMLDFSQSERPDQVIEKLRQDITEANGKEQVPLWELKNQLGKEKYKDLFDVILVFDNYPAEIIVEKSNDFTADHPYDNINLSIAQTEFPLRVDVWLEGNTQLVMSGYRDYFSEEDMVRIFSHFLNILEESLSVMEALITP
jgi:amino acid adenylation domain-containing protein